MASYRARAYSDQNQIKISLISEMKQEGVGEVIDVESVINHSNQKPDTNEKSPEESVMIERSGNQSSEASPYVSTLARPPMIFKHSSPGGLNPPSMLEMPSFGNLQP